MRSMGSSGMKRLPKRQKKDPQVMSRLFLGLNPEPLNPKQQSYCGNLDLSPPPVVAPFGLLRLFGFLKG